MHQCLTMFITVVKNLHREGWVDSNAHGEMAAEHSSMRLLLTGFLSSVMNLPLGIFL